MRHNHTVTRARTRDSLQCKRKNCEVFTFLRFCALDCRLANRLQRRWVPTAQLPKWTGPMNGRGSCLAHDTSESLTSGMLFGSRDWRRVRLVVGTFCLSFNKKAAKLAYHTIEVTKRVLLVSQIKTVWVFSNINMWLLACFLKNIFFRQKNL